MKKSILQKIGTLVMFGLILSSLPSCFSTKKINTTITTKVSGNAISINSTPEGATVLHNGKTIGTTPCTFKLNEYESIIDLNQYKLSIEEIKTQYSYNFTFVKDGYEITNAVFAPHVTKTENYFASIAAIDYPKTFSAILEKKTNNKKDPTIVEGEDNNMVSRDTPGATALEQTIIRWYFDSEPRGARLYWRIVSSIPSIVKNTNELYLGTTPYEETRSFNILGLTYENSRDVQIEIKLSRPGYMDQVKRFNVRQAIDQQEISSFFDLIKKDY